MMRSKLCLVLDEVRVWGKMGFFWLEGSVKVWVRNRSGIGFSRTCCLLDGFVWLVLVWNEEGVYSGVCWENLLVRRGRSFEWE